MANHGRIVKSLGGTCRSCKQRIAKDEDCNYHNFLGARHIDCVDIPLAPPTPQPPVRRDPRMPVEHPWAEDEE